MFRAISCRCQRSAVSAVTMDEAGAAGINTAPTLLLWRAPLTSSSSCVTNTTSFPVLALAVSATVAFSRNRPSQRPRARVTFAPRRTQETRPAVPQGTVITTVGDAGLVPPSFAAVSTR